MSEKSGSSHRLITFSAHLFPVSLVPFATSWIAGPRPTLASAGLCALIFAVMIASYLALVSRSLGGFDIFYGKRFARRWLTGGAVVRAPRLGALDLLKEARRPRLKSLRARL